MIRTQALLLDVKIVVDDTTAQSFALVAHSSTVPATVSSKFVGKYSLKQGQEATDKSMLQEVQDQ